MNILFIDFLDENDINKLKNSISINKLDLKLGFKLLKCKINNNINCLYIIKSTSKINWTLLKIIIRLNFKKKHVYIVTSKSIDEANLDLKKLFSTFNDKLLINCQNNLLANDRTYIEEYINKNCLEKNKVKILFVIDNLDKVVRKKIEEFILEYKFVDIYPVRFIHNIYDYVNNLNYKLGTVIEVLDKLKEEDYNIFLVFCNKHKISRTSSSYILDYKNSELDVKSNTYLIYQNNRNYYDKIFENLGTNVSRFDKTKLGKLYIHASGIILDK